MTCPPALPGWECCGTLGKGRGGVRRGDKGAQERLHRFGARRVRARPITRPPPSLPDRKPPHRLALANKTSTLYSSRPLLTASFEGGEQKCTA